MKLQLVKGTTSQNVLIFIQNNAVTTGAGLAGLAWNTSSLTCFFYREDQGSSATAITLASATIGSWTTSGFVEIDSSGMPGWYELGIPNAVLASGADFVGIQLKGAANMAQLNLEIQLTNIDMNNGVSGGMTALPSAAADAAGGLVISDDGGVDMDNMEDSIVAIEIDTGTTLQAELDAIQVAVITAATGANIAADIIALKAQTVDIEADTNQLQVDWLDNGRLDVILDLIAADTNELQVDWANDGRLDAILDLIAADTNELQVDWTNNGRLDALLDLVVADVDGLNGAAMRGTNNAALAATITLDAINAEVDRALVTTTYTEPGQGAPGVNISIGAKINYLYKAWRNRVESTSTKYSIYNDAENVIDQTAVLSDDATTGRRTEIVSGPGP